MGIKPQGGKLDNSEIINQKKQLIFEVDQTSDFVFPNEEYKYYIYIKNISGTLIKNFTIQIEKGSGIYIKPIEEEHCGIDINPDEIKLYEIKASCPLVGKHIIHFIGFGLGTQLLHRSLEIQCSRLYNSDTVLHRLHIYDFTPYEDKYSLEADNYSNQVTQTFKRQKLPYKSGEQPFGLINEFEIKETEDEHGEVVKTKERKFYPENIESQSFLDQYMEAKNSNEHVYQYISRENFTEDSVESYTGENLSEIFEKINQNSKYFRGKLIKSGTNHLLNDFTQYAPNGFIYRMGLLNSEIYHNLGVVPTYSYMSDRLFRWAPSEKQLLDLIPEKKAMKWGENIWAGRGWIVYRATTKEYEETEEFAKKVEDNLIEREEIIGGYEDKRTAEEVIERLKEWDDVQRTNERSNLVKYDYYMTESLYDTGVFFINIPVDKIPSNFYLLDNESLYALINRTKPYGTKPIVNYIIERTFSQNMEQKCYLNYHKDFLFSLGTHALNYEITQNEYTMKTIECEGGGSVSYPAFIPKRVVLSEDFYNEQEMDIFVDYSQIGMNDLLDMTIEEEAYIYETKPDYRLNTLNDILETLYQGNYNQISFKLKPKDFNLLKLNTNDELSFSEEEGEIILIKNNSNIETDSFKVDIPKDQEFLNGNIELDITIEDSLGKKHKLYSKHDIDLNMEFISYSYIKKNGEEIIKERGYQDIKSLVIGIGKIYNKKIILFLVENKKTRTLHYFHHVIVQDTSSITINKFVNKEKQTIDKIHYGKDLFSSSIIFETPFIKKSQIFQPKLIKGGENWNNLKRLNNKENSFSYIKNLTNEYLTANNIYLYYDQINLPETAIIDKLRFRVVGTGANSPSSNIYIGEAFNTNYLSEEMNGYELQLTPQKIECYSHLKESTSYYQAKLDIAKKKEQNSFIEYFEKLLEENYIFNEDIDVETSDYLTEPNDFITIDNQFWYELSEFSDLSYKLNELESIKFIIEGYNTKYETKLSVETLSETEHSSTVSKNIPSGYFREKINLLYSNNFLLELLRVRFRFNQLNHNIKIFDTKIELKFKNKHQEEIKYNFLNEIDISKENNKINTLLENYYNPSDINNGTILELSFDELKPGGYYNLNSTELELIYTDTDIDIMVNDNKYKDVFYGINKSSLFGIVEDAYMSGLFYNDVPTMIQAEDNVGLSNKGIKLQDSLYQQFETRDDNITSIEIFPYGFKGNPDETLKIGLYENSYNTPGKLIKEVLVSGWVKNNDQLKNLGRIKYNFNIDNLEINKKYWFKIQVINSQENSYYLLKGINNTKSGFKLLTDENNNYINTFSNLKFNIYSKNLSQSFNNLPVLQEYLDNPYILIGLHKEKGTIKRLETEKYIKSVSGDDYMSEVFELNEEPSIEIFSITEKRGNQTKELDTTIKGDE